MYCTAFNESVYETDNSGKHSTLTVTMATLMMMAILITLMMMAILITLMMMAIMITLMMMAMLMTMMIPITITLMMMAMTTKMMIKYQEYIEQTLITCTSTTCMLVGYDIGFNCSCS